MTTKLVGVKDFRQNLARYTKILRNGGIRLIILKKNIPILEVKVIDEANFALETLRKDIAEARHQVKRDKVYTQEEIMREFGLL